MSAKKLSVTPGLVLALVTIVCAVASLVSYYINTETAYFGNLGVDTTVMACGVIAVVLEVAVVALGQGGRAIWKDLLPVAVTVLLVVATITLVSIRVGSFAAIITFENNSSNMSDLTSAMVAIILGVVASATSIVGAHFDIAPER